MYVPERIYFLALSASKTVDATVSSVVPERIYFLALSASKTVDATVSSVACIFHTYP